MVFSESIIKIQRDLLQIEDQSPYEYYSLLTPPFAVIILALTPEGQFVLTEEYRHPTGKIILGCPGGFVDLNEDPIEAGKRELLEETGFQANSYQIIGSAFPYSGISRQKTIYIRALSASFHNPPHLEKSEIISTKLVSASSLSKITEDEKELDGTLCTALFFHQMNPIHYNTL